MSLLRRIVYILIGSAILFLIAAQIAASVLLKPLLEREGSRIFHVPVSVGKAGANILGGYFWMKGVRIKNASGFKEPDFLSARTISVRLNLLSLLTNEFVIEQILLKDPQFTFEVHQEGSLNASQFADEMLQRFKKFVGRKPKFIHLISKYTLEKFAVRNGALQLIDARKPESNWTFRAISFSLARLVYPPDPEEALPVAIYLNATVPSTQEGKIFLLGRLNPFALKKSFDITGSGKGLILSQYGDFLPEFPLRFTGGILQFKVKALCHENQVDIYHQVHVDNLKFESKEIIQKKSPLVFGLPQKTVVRFFNDLQPSSAPFEFDFRVAGDLDDSKFNVFSSIEEKIRDIVYERVTAQMESISKTELK